MPSNALRLSGHSGRGGGGGGGMSGNSSLQTASRVANAANEMAWSPRLRPAGSFEEIDRSPLSRTMSPREFFDDLAQSASSSFSSRPRKPSNSTEHSRLINLFRSATSLSDLAGEENGQVSCISSSYKVPSSVVRKAMQRLDMELCPGYPGELRSAQVVDILSRFDHAFDSLRSDAEREFIVSELEHSTQDFSRVRWSDKRLLRAFTVVLNLQEKIYFTIDMGDSSTRMSKIVSGVMVATILVSIILWMAGTMPEVGVLQCQTCTPDTPTWMEFVDEICVFIFTMEYLTRLLTVSSVRFELLQSAFLMELLTTHGDKRPVPVVSRGYTKFCAFLRSPAALCDLATVLPFWAEVLFEESHANFPWLRMFRLLRVSRVFKLFRLLNSDLGSLNDVQNLLQTVVKQALPAAAMTILLVLAALLVFSSLMYTVERGSWYPHDQILLLAARDNLYSGPTDKGYFIRLRPSGLYEVSPYASIPDAAWWTLATITTVGYGDSYPVTPMGKVVGCVAILYGTILLGLPIGIIGSQFSSEFGKMVTIGRRRQEALRQKAAGRATAAAAAAAAAREPSSPGLPIRQSSDFNVGNLPVPEHEVSTPMGWLGAAKRRLSQVTSTLTPRSMKRLTAVKMECGLERIFQLPLSQKDQEMLQNAKTKFEDATQIFGEQLGISLEVQQRWHEALMATHFTAGPAWDDLGIRILTTLAEAELARPTASAGSQKVRLAWHELSLLACRAAEVSESFDAVQKRASVRSVAANAAQLLLKLEGPSRQERDSSNNNSNTANNNSNGNSNDRGSVISQPEKSDKSEDVDLGFLLEARTPSNSNSRSQSLHTSFNQSTAICLPDGRFSL